MEILDVNTNANQNAINPSTDFEPMCFALSRFGQTLEWPENYLGKAATT